MKTYLLLGISVIVLAISCIAYVVVSPLANAPDDRERQTRDVFAVEEEYPTSGGQQMRPRF